MNEDYGIGAEFDVMIGNKNVHVIRKFLPQRLLQFYIENPRVYSLFDRSEKDPTQEEMEEKLCACDDVKALRQSIESNGGLITPILVKDGDLVVLEGNRRLACYRMLAKKDPDRWANIPCDVYPEDLDENTIFRLLGQCHINGQKKWAPFEEAGYIYRWVNNTQCTIKDAARELGISEANIRNRYEVYAFMVEKDDLQPDHWSYYEEYLKSRDLKKVRKKYSNLDDVVVKQVKSGKIDDAKRDIRETLVPIAKRATQGDPEEMEGFIKEDYTLKQCDSKKVKTSQDAYDVLYKFRSKVCDPKFRDTVYSIPKKDHAKFIKELKIIGESIKNMTEHMEHPEVAIQLSEEDVLQMYPEK